jgi:hypothetical protein
MRQSLVLISFLIAGCGHTGSHDLTEPPYESRLYRTLKCEAHIMKPWRTVSARSFRGRVLISGEREPAGFPGAVVAVRKRGDLRIHETAADEHGRFGIADLEDGVYEFVACTRGIGMDPDTGWVVLSRRAPDEDIDLFLRYGV